MEYEYSVHHNNGGRSHSGMTSEHDAYLAIYDTYGEDPVISEEWEPHGSNGDERQLVWRTEADSENDDGSKAIAEIIRSKR